MRTVNFTQKYSLFEFNGAFPYNFSDYDLYIDYIAGVNSNKSGFLVYQPGYPSPITAFQPASGYIVIKTPGLTFSMVLPDVVKPDVLKFKRRYNIFTYPYSVPLDFSNYSDYLETVLITNPGGTGFISYSPGYASPFTAFEPGSSYLVVAYGDFDMVNPEPTPTSTSTPEPTPNTTPTVTPTSTLIVTPTPTLTPTPQTTPATTPAATNPVTPSVTPSVTSSPGASPVATSTQTPTPTRTPVQTSTPTPTRTPVITTTPTTTPTKTPLSSPTPTTTTPLTTTPTPSVTMTKTPTMTPTVTPTDTPVSTSTPTPTKTSAGSPTVFYFNDRAPIAVYSNDIEANSYGGSSVSPSLTGVQFGSSAKRLGSYTFYNTSISGELVIDYVNTINTVAIYSNNSLKSITFTNSVTAIDTGSIYINPSLSAVRIGTGFELSGPINQGYSNILLYPENLRSITIDPNNPYFTSDGLAYYNKLKTTIVGVVPGLSGTFTIPGTVDTVGRQAFYNVQCNNIIIPEGVKYLQDSCFTGMGNLTALRAPDSLLGIGTMPFTNCHKMSTFTIPRNVSQIGYGLSFARALSAIYVDPANTYFTSSSGILFNKTMTTLLAFNTGKDRFTKLSKFSIPSGVTAIGDYAFAFAPLSSIQMPISLNTIGNVAFGHTSLYDVTISNSVTALGSGAFSSITSLTGVYIPSSVVSFGQDCFRQAYNLKSAVVLTKNIPDWAFGEDQRLANLTVSNSLSYIGSFAFYNTLELINYNFTGNAPVLGYNALGPVGTVYYCSNKTGFTNPFGGRPSVQTGPC